VTSPGAGASPPAPDTDTPAADPGARRPTGTAHGSGPTDGRVEVLVGGIVVALTVLAALWLRHHPGPVVLDRWGSSLVHPSLHSRFWRRVTDLRSIPVLVGGSVLAAVVVVTRDRWRAVACLVAPTMAVAMTEYVLKPVVGRRYAEVLSFPSGTTTVVGSVATAWVLAAPRLIRPAVATVAAIAVVLECMAVVALQWHYPSDAVAGAAFGAGFVVLVDGVLHLGAGHAPARQGADALSGGSPTR